MNHNNSHILSFILTNNFLFNQDFHLLMKQEEPKKQPVSLFQAVNLPPKRSLNAATQCIFEKSDINSEEAKFINPRLKQRRDEFINEIEDELTLYEDTAYNFKFPESKFAEVPEGKKNNISYELKIQAEQEDTFANRLSDLQLKQIKQKGEFQVRSKSQKATIPYIWKINGCLFRGRVKRVLAWEEGLARIYGMMDQTIDLLLQVVPYNLGKLVNLPVRLFALIFGRRKLKLLYTPDVSRQVFKDFWTDIMQNQLKDLKDEIGHQFLEQLYQPYDPALYEQLDPHNAELQVIQNQKINKYNEKKRKIDALKGTLRNLQATFQYNWLKIRKNVLTKVSTQMEERSIKYLMSENDEQPLNEAESKKKDENIMHKFHQEKYLIYTAHVKQSIAKQNMSKQVVQSLTALMVIVGLIEAKMKVKNSRLAQTQANIRQNIKKKHPIRSNYHKFVNQSVNKLYKPLQEQIENQFYDQLMKDTELRKRLSQKYLSIYEKYVMFKKNYNALIEQKKQNMKSLYEPQRVFRTTYILFPPYERLFLNGYYSLKKKEQLRTDTSSHFWKCSLYAMRLKSWSINCFKFMVGMCWASPLGLRCLFGIANFAYDENCDPNTGVKIQLVQTPFLGRFCKVLRGIGKSRNAFEALPDRGLFGKNCSRICNYLECYVFRFFFVGVIGVLMLYPVVIVAFSCICFVGILTFWLWVPLCMFLCYLFNILVFQFEISFQSSGCLIRSIPLVSLVLLILVYILKIIGSILLLFVFTPLACILYFLFLVFQRIMRTFTDAVMLCFMGCLGRTPSRDTSIAKKISGPGMSRNYFYSIAEQDVYILTQCALQKLQVEKFAALTRTQIQKSSQKYNTICNFSLKPFGYQRPNVNANKNFVEANTNQLTNHFNKKLQNYMARYPNNPRNVRFTKEEIELYFENCVKIVRNFVEKQRIQDWVFDQFHILFEDYDELTRKVWMQIFNCGEEIFEPIQKIDNRFQLLDEDSDDEDGSTKQYKGSIMKALQGQIELTRQKVNFSPARKSLLAKDEQICNINTILALQQSNNGIIINVNLSNPSTIFVPHRNLNELKDYDIYQRQMVLKNRPKIIEQ